MGNVERSGSDGRANWPVKFGGAIGGAAGVAFVLVVLPWAETRGFWPGGFWLGVLSICIAGGVGQILGALVASSAFRPPPGNGPRD